MHAKYNAFFICTNNFFLLLCNLRGKQEHRKVFCSLFLYAVVFQYYFTPNGTKTITLLTWCWAVRSIVVVDCVAIHAVFLGFNHRAMGQNRTHFIVPEPLRWRRTTQLLQLPFVQYAENNISSPTTKQALSSARSMNSLKKNKQQHFLCCTFLSNSSSAS